jgi:hypothetical protein
MTEQVEKRRGLRRITGVLTGRIHVDQVEITLDQAGKNNLDTPTFLRRQRMQAKVDSAQAPKTPQTPDNIVPPSTPITPEPDTAAAKVPAKRPARTTARKTATNNADNKAHASTHRRQDTDADDAEKNKESNDQNHNRLLPMSILGGSTLIGAGLLAVALSRGGTAPIASAFATGSEGPSSIPTDAKTSTAPSIAASQGTEKAFPTTKEAVIATLGGNINPDFVMKGYTEGKANGTWQIEAFPLLDGVHSDGNGDFVDASGNVLTDPNKVYNFSAKPQWINSLSLTIPRAYLFARSGGDVPVGQQANISRFDGTLNSTITGAFEQAALIPNLDCDPATAAWRDAVNNYTWNGDAQKGTVKIEWYNPETKQLQQIDGRMITAYSKAGIDIAKLIQEMPGNYPITPDQAAGDTGGTTKAANWTLDAKTGNWTYEGFQLASGIIYDAKKGVHTDSKGNVITDLAKIFDYSKYDVNTWPTSMTAVNIPNTYTFMRTGGASEDQPNTSWYGFGNATITLKGHGIEQATIILIPATPVCTSIEAVARKMAPDAISAARNTGITVEVWDGKNWVIVPAAAAS